MSEIKAKSPVDSSVAGVKPMRAKSGMVGPYYTLDSSIKVPAMIHEKGGGSCSVDQLVSWLGYSSTKNGGYLTRISAAKAFGLIASQGDQFVITERARSIISPVMGEDAAAAKVDAFLSVPLFAAVYEKFKGVPLHPEVGLKNLFENTFKVVPDRVAPSLRIFYESAQTAGFFEASGDRTRLVKTSFKNGKGKTDTPPPIDDVPPLDEKKTGGGGGSGGTGGGEDLSGIHPALLGLLKNLPAVGQTLGPKRRAALIAAFTSTINFVYPEQEDEA